MQVAAREVVMQDCLDTTSHRGTLSNIDPTYQLSSAVRDRSVRLTMNNHAVDPLDSPSYTI